MMAGLAATAAMPAARVARAPKVAARRATGRVATGRPEIARQVIARVATAPVASARLQTGRPVIALPVIVLPVIGHVGIDPPEIARHATPQHHVVTGPLRRRVIARRVRQVIAPSAIDRRARTVARKVASAATGVVVCKARGPSPWARVRGGRAATAVVGLAASRVVMRRETALRPQPCRRL
jgi:hypothetical protein